MNKFNFLIAFIPLCFVMNIKAETLPANIINEIKTEFPQCATSLANAVPVIGSLFGKHTKDMAVTLTCSENNDWPYKYKIFILLEGANGNYRIASQNEEFDSNGFTSFDLIIKNNSLFLHTAVPSMTLAEIVDYQFKYGGKQLILIGKELQTEYHGNGEPNEYEVEYHQSTNYLTGRVIDSRFKPKQKRQKISKIPFEKFFEMANIWGYDE